MAKQKRRIYCKFCDFFCYTPEDFVSHLEKKHSELIPEDMTPWQFSYYLRHDKTHGNCIVCGSKTSWNEVTHKYNRFCDNPKCKEKYRELFKNRMIGKYGKTTLLNDPEQQKKMLANRKISGEYLWRDHYHKTRYTGSYEKSFLEFLDTVMDFDPEDIMAPSPHTYWYEYEGKKHFYIPDFFIPSLNLEIEIKDGGDNPNKHHKIQEVDKVKEALKDDVMKKNQFNYLKIVNTDNKKFFDFLDKAREQVFDNIQKPIYMTEQVYDFDSNIVYTEGNNDEESINEKISFSNSFTDVKNIVDSLPDSDLNRICNGTFKNSHYVIYRDVLLINNTPVSFIDVYKLPDMKEDGVIVLATNPKYRNKGYSSKLISRMNKNLKGKKLIWKTQKDNVNSIKLAKKNNYIPFIESVSTKNINTIIFDLGSVLVRSTARENVAKTKIPDEYIDELAFEYFSNAHGITETMTVDELKSYFKDKLKPELKKYADEAIDLFASSKKPFDYTVELLKSLKKKGYKLYYLSNWNKASFTLCKEKGVFDFLKLFDGGVVSYQVNMLKPNKEIYNYLIKKYNLDPETSLFYDDKKENVETAKKLNMQAVQFSFKNHTEKDIINLPSII